MPDAVPAPTGPTAPAFRFGPAGRFELRPSEYRLLIDGQPATLGGRALDLLIALVERRDRLVSKNELIELVWPGLVVEENNLRVQITHLRKVVGDEVITTVPGRGYRFSAPMANDAGTTATAAPAPPARPASRGPRLFGRGADLERLRSLLQATGGCVTLVGPGGVGKSSLARAAMAQHGGRSVWVDLATLTHGGQVAGAIARALDKTLAEGEPLPQLLATLQDAATASLLLVLDNAEHVVGHCAEAASCLARSPARLLVTSQLPLKIVGEREMRLDPLALDAPDLAPRGVADGIDEAALGDGAVALLVARITALDPRFRVARDSWPWLTALCRHLDGLPLALEMAAARVPVMGPRAVHDALTERFAMLTRGHRDASARHRTVRHALQWSHDLLQPEEQRLFRRLGVFAGGFTLDLAVAVVGEPGTPRWDIVDGLTTLVERSLVAANGDDPPRYRLLETMRAFALEQLAAAGDANEPTGEPFTTRARLAAALVAITSFPPVDEKEAVALAEMENAREALAWATAHDLTRAALLSSRYAGAAAFTVWRQETTDWLLSLQAAMEQPPGRALPPIVQAEWWMRLAYMLSMRFDPRAAVAAVHAVELARPLNDPHLLMTALTQHLRGLRSPGPELDQALSELQAFVAATPDLPARSQISVQGALVMAAAVRGDHEGALRGYEMQKVLSQQLEWHDSAQAAESNIVFGLNKLDRHAEATPRARTLLAGIDAEANGEANGNLPYVLEGLIEALVGIGALKEAQALVPRATASALRFGTQVVTKPLIELATAQQRFELAARLVGHARRVSAAEGLQVDPFEERAIAHALAAAGAALGAPLADALLQQGRQLSDQAVAELLCTPPR